MTRKTKAFTLIELLIVIVIIGILAVALIPRLTGSQATARDTARKATLQQVATVISAYVNSEQNPAPLATGAIAQITSTAINTVSNYGNIPDTAAGYPIYIHRDGANHAYVISVALEKGNGNLASTGVASGNVVPGSLFSTGNAFAIRAQ